MAVILLSLSLPVVTSAQPALDPNAVRDVAINMGLGPLGQVVQTDPPELLNYIRATPAVADATTNPPTTAPVAAVPTPKDALLILGKALFWDQQVGSDGQACASCHFNAGADNRTKNQINSGTNSTDPEEAILYNPTGSGNAGGNNYTLIGGDFPFHKLADPMQTNYKEREVLFDTDDVASSQGSFLQQFVSIPATSATMTDTGTRLADLIFNVGGVNVRQVEERNTPSAINATFGFWNFWDGRAHDQFNGVDPLGPINANAFIYTNQGGLLQQTVAIISGSSLASQAVGPPVSTDEMSFVGRTWPDIGRKLLRLSPTVAATAPTPLGFQQVDPTDSVLGVVDLAGNGISVNYRQLVQWAFQPQYWSSAGPTAGTTLLTPTGFHLMENNMSLFFGLAVQAYEQTLVSDQTPYDAFMAGDNNAFGDPNSAAAQDIMKGLLTFINTESATLGWNPIFNGIESGSCQLCHSGPELTENTKVNVPGKFFITNDVTAEMDQGRELVIVASTQMFDVGFSNVGTRPSREDLGRGRYELGKPLSLFRQFITGLVIPPGPLVPLALPFPNPARGTNIDGAFKIPQLRNIELTGPYFHNGGMLTLAQSVQFYARTGDYADVNINEIDIGLIMPEISDVGVDLIVKFLLSLTDERVRLEAAPFDHPSLVIPNGHPGNNVAVTGFTTVGGVAQANDTTLTLQATGAAGWPNAAASPVRSFLNVSNTQGDPGWDHFDR